MNAHPRLATITDHADCYVLAAQSVVLSQFQVEGIRRILIRQLRRLVNCGGRILVRTVPVLPRTRRKLSIRMGGAKSPFSSLFYKLRPGAVLFELSGLPKVFGVGSLTAMVHRLPIAATVCWR